MTHGIPKRLLENAQDVRLYQTVQGQVARLDLHARFDLVSDRELRRKSCQGLFKILPGHTPGAERRDCPTGLDGGGLEHALRDVEVTPALICRAGSIGYATEAQAQHPQLLRQPIVQLPREPESLVASGHGGDILRCAPQHVRQQQAVAYEAKCIPDRNILSWQGREWNSPCLREEDED